MCESLQKLFQTKSNDIRILIGGDFNLPSISWLDVGNINASPTYTYELNQKLLETINNLTIGQSTHSRKQHS